MSTEKPNLPHFEAVRDSDEEILWMGKPAFIPFILSGIPFLIIGLIWGVLDISLFRVFTKNSMMGEMSAFLTIFFIIHLFPCWGSILNLLRLWLVHGNTWYAYTNKRLMMRSGFWGTDFKAIDYDKIMDLTVTVNPIEKIFGVGTVSAFTGNTTAKGVRIYDRFMAIRDPYEVFKKIKELSVDVKTDWNFPNALRPETNPGYRTKYDPSGKR
ncbi:MAG TPA: PH domain-containing protein [Firmicutes bacterium]|nr:PH domain-containing protein [Bacillota bacterium]